MDKIWAANMLMSAGSSFATSCGESGDFHLCNPDLNLKPHSSTPKKKNLLEKELAEIDRNMPMRQLYTHVK